MSDDKQPLTVDVFPDSRDQQLMQEWKTAYVEAFRSQSMEKFTQHPIDPSHQAVPDGLNITIETRERFFGLSHKEIGCLPFKLLSAQLKPAYFKDTSEAYTSAINCHLTKSLIAEGTNYVDAIEEAPLKRGTWHPFEAIHRPDYYLIFVICERVKALCKTGETATLVSEYICLLDFLNRATTVAQSYLTTSGDVHPFHRYLQQAHRLITRMKKRTIFYIERMAMATALEKVINSLDTYRAELAVYLLYAVSDAPLNEGLNLSQLTDDNRSLPPAFTQTAIYVQLRRAVKRPPPHKSHQGLPTFALLDTNDNGVSELLREYAGKSKHHREQVRVALNAYRQLVQALCLLSRLITNLRALVKATQCHGEYQIVHDATLSATLNAHLLWVDFFLSGCQQAMKCINDQNNRLLQGHENLKRGATGNIKRAESQTDLLLAIAQPITAHHRYINQRIEKIRALNPKVLVAERNALFRKTARLLTETQNNAIIPEHETAKLLAELQKNCPQKEIETDNAGSSSKEATTSQSLESNAGMRNSSKEKGDKILRETFPDIYVLIDKHPEWQSTFESTLNALYAEIDEVLLRLIQQLELAIDIIHQIDIEVQTIEAMLPQLLTGSHFTSLIGNFENLKNILSGMSYLGNPFLNLSFLDKLIPEYYSPMRNQELSKIKQLFLLADSSESNKNVRKGCLPSDKLYRSVLMNLARRAEKIPTKIDQLKSRLSQSTLPTEENITLYYQEKINQNLLKLPPEDRPGIFDKSIALKGSQIHEVDSSPVEITTIQKKPTLPNVSTPRQNFGIVEVDEAATTPLLAVVENLSRVGHHQQILSMCTELFSGNLNALEMKNKMDRLINLLATINYTFNYGGGEWIQPADRGTEKKVPKHIAKIFRYYNLVMRHGHHWTLGDLIALRNQLFSIISQAAKQPPTFCFFLSLRDEQNTQVIYNTMAESSSAQKRLAELGVLCDKLYDDGGNIAETKEQLGALMQSLLDLPYDLNYFASEKLTPNGQAPRKVPYPVKFAFKTFQDGINQVSTKEQAQGLRNTIFNQIKEATENPPKVCCGLFSPSYCETTQAIYRTVRDISASRDQPSSIIYLTP